MSALSGSVLKETRDLKLSFERIIDHLRDGTFEEAIMETTLDHDEGWRVDVRIDGEWYRIELVD